MQPVSAANRVVVIGGGYIGLGAAAALIKFAKHVTVVEQLDRLLVRVAGVDLPCYIEREHRRHGVDVMLGTAVDCLLG